MNDDPCRDQAPNNKQPDQDSPTPDGLWQPWATIEQPIVPGPFTTTTGTALWTPTTVYFRFDKEQP